jgi:hypothetical protein
MRRHSVKPVNLGIVDRAVYEKFQKELQSTKEELAETKKGYWELFDIASILETKGDIVDYYEGTFHCRLCGKRTVDHGGSIDRRDHHHSYCAITTLYQLRERLRKYGRV